MADEVDWKDSTQWDIPDGEFCVYGTVYTHPEHSDKVEAFYQQTTKNAPSEPGTIMYCLGRDRKDPSIFYFFERYASKEAFKAHNNAHQNTKMGRDFMTKGWVKDVKAVFVKPILPAE